MKFIKSFVYSFNPDLPLSSLNQFKELIQQKGYSKKQLIHNQDKFYIIKSGIIRSYILNKKNKKITQDLYVVNKNSKSSGNIICTSMENLKYECLTDCILYECNLSDLYNLMRENHTIAILFNKFLEQKFIYKEKDINYLTVLNSKERYLRLLKDTPEIKNLLPQYLIASCLNISSMQLSRIKKDI